MFNEWLAPVILLSVIGSTWTLAWWFSRQFGSLSNLIYSKTEQLEKFILDKIEYHEKHDDERFSQITNQMWEMRLAQALKDKILDQEAIGRKVRAESSS